MIAEVASFEMARRIMAAIPKEHTILLIVNTIDCSKWLPIKLRIEMNINRKPARKYL